MKRLLLVSMFQRVWTLLKTVEPDLHNKTVAFIPTASRVEPLGFFVRLGKWKLRRLGLRVEEVDLSAAYETIAQKLRQSDLIYVSGGNTFYLLQELRRTGADQLLVQEIDRGKLYIGESAGAIVVSPHIGYCAMMDRAEKAPGLSDDTGLHAVEFYVVPHAQNWEMGKAAQRIVDAYAQKLDLKVLRDDQALLVEGGTVTLLEA